MARLTLLLTVLTTIVALLGGFRYLIDTLQELRWRKKHTGKWLLFILVWMVPAIADAACSGASPTWTAADASRTEVTACITAASAGDTINVPSGTQTWATTVTITKNVSIIGAGIGNTNITCSMAAPCISYDPVSTANLFRISGFTFDGNNTDRGSGTDAAIIYLQNNQLGIYQVRIDHNRFQNLFASNQNAAIITRGVKGVIDNNVIVARRVAFRAFGDESGTGSFDWTNYGPITLGNVDQSTSNANMYLEDNDITVGDGSGFYMVADCDEGGRYVFRYNKFTPDQDFYPVLDWHGGRGALKGCFAGEIYGNQYQKGDFMISQRGGRGMFHHNNITSASSGSFNVYNNDGCPGSTDERLNNTYSWLSRRNVTGALIGNSNSGGDVCGDIVEGTTYFTQSSGYVSVGAVGSRPGTCTVGYGYWETSQSTTSLSGMTGIAPTTPVSGTLYKCTSTNVWTAYYTPYTYPHPLRSGVGGGSSSTIVLFLEWLVAIVSVGWHARAILLAGSLTLLSWATVVTVPIWNHTKALSYQTAVHTIHLVNRLTRKS